MANETTPSDADKLLLLEETLRIVNNTVVVGRVRVSTAVETTEHVARADLRSEDVEVTRVPVNQPVVGTLPETRQEGDVTIVPVFEEIFVVEKRLVLKEEIHIRRRSKVEPFEVPVSLRRQTARIERSGGET